MKTPLLAVFMLTLDDGTEIYRSPPIERVMPGETVNVEWAYPLEGVVPVEPATLPATLRHGESATFTSTETYPPN